MKAAAFKGFLLVREAGVELRTDQVIQFYPVLKTLAVQGLIVTSNYFAAEGGVTMCHAVFLRP